MYSYYFANSNGVYGFSAGNRDSCGRNGFLL